MLIDIQTVPVADLASRGLARDVTRPRPVALVVDDERIIADTLVAILRRHGFAAFAAYDGESALEMARVIPPQVLVSDVVMPGMSGVDLAVAVRDTIPDCRVLLFSGQASTVDVLASARNAGYEFALISKPVHPTDLLARISELDIAGQDWSR